MTGNCVYSFIFSLSLCDHKFHEDLGIFVPLVPCCLLVPRSIPGTLPTKWIKKPPICNCVNIRVTDTLKGKAVTFIMLNSKYLARQMRLQTKWREKKKPKRIPQLPKVAPCGMPCKQVRLPGRLEDQTTEEEESYTKNGIYLRRRSWGVENRRDQRCSLQAQLQAEPCTRERSWGEQNPRGGTWDSTGHEAPCRVTACRGLPAPILSKVWALPGQVELMGSRGPQHFQHRRGLMSKRTPGFSSREHREENEVRPSYINSCCNRQIAQGLETKRRDSRINVHSASEQRLNRKQ